MGTASVHWAPASQGRGAELKAGLLSQKTNYTGEANEFREKRVVTHNPKRPCSKQKDLPRGSFK